MEKSTGKDTLSGYEENLINLKKDKRKAQFKFRIEKLLDEENRIDDDLENPMDKVGE